MHDESAPAFRAPPLSCDCHFHVFRPAERYPYGPELRSAPPQAPLDEYLARALIEAAPERVIWGSDYPHPSFAGKVGSVELSNLPGRWAPDEAMRRKILVENPQRLFGF